MDGAVVTGRDNLGAVVVVLDAPHLRKGAITRQNHDSLFEMN